MSPKENASEFARVRLRPSVKAVIEELADAMDVLPSEFIRLAIDEKIKREQRKIVRLQQEKAS